MHFSDTTRSEFYSGLQKEVNRYFTSKGISKKGDIRIYLKGLLLLLVYCGAYFSIYRFQDNINLLLLLYFLMGISGVMIVFNIVHDASHNALSRSRFINKAFTYLGDFVGINTYIWDIRHNIQHHTYTNVLGGDLIIENIPIIRLSQHQKLHNYHKYQHYYAPVLYFLYSFYWIFIIDFKLFFKREICNLKNLKHSNKEWSILWGFKLFYLSYSLILPWILTDLSFLQAFLLLLFMHLCGGVLLSYVAVLGHFVEGPSFPDTVEDEIQNNWAEHELEATIDFAPNSRLVNWITGGLNTHIAHHLFPSISHVHYRSITPIIKNYCEQHGYEYKSESLTSAFASHFKYLKRLSTN